MAGVAARAQVGTRILMSFCIVLSILGKRVILRESSSYVNEM